MTLAAQDGSDVALGASMGDTHHKGRWHQV